VASRLYVRDSHIPPKPLDGCLSAAAGLPPGGALLTAPGPTTGRPHFVGPTLLLPSSGVGLHAFVMFIAPILSSFAAHVRDWLVVPAKQDRHGAATRGGLVPPHSSCAPGFC
jgi:hypothetical protein